MPELWQMESGYKPGAPYLPQLADVGCSALHPGKGVVLQLYLPGAGCPISAAVSRCGMQRPPPRQRCGSAVVLAGCRVPGAPYLPQLADVGCSALHPRKGVVLQLYLLSIITGTFHRIVRASNALRTAPSGLSRMPQNSSFSTNTHVCASKLRPLLPVLVPTGRSLQSLSPNDQNPTK